MFCQLIRDSFWLFGTPNCTECGLFKEREKIQYNIYNTYVQYKVVVSHLSPWGYPTPGGTKHIMCRTKQSAVVCCTKLFSYSYSILTTQLRESIHTPYSILTHHTVLISVLTIHIICYFVS